MRREHWNAFVFVLLSAVLIGCSGDSSGSGEPVGPAEPVDPGEQTAAPEPTHMAATGDTAYSTVAGEVIEDGIAVRVTDEDGEPVEGVTVEWAVTAGGGSVVGTGATGSDGIAGAVWTLGTVAGEAQVLEGSVDSVGSVAFHATVEAGPPSAVVISPDSVRLDVPGDTLRLSASLEDAYGNAVDEETTVA